MSSCAILKGEERKKKKEEEKQIDTTSSRDEIVSVINNNCYQMLLTVVTHTRTYNNIIRPLLFYPLLLMSFPVVTKSHTPNKHNNHCLCDSYFLRSRMSSSQHQTMMMETKFLDSSAIVLQINVNKPDSIIERS